MNFLLYIENSAENLQFYLWYRDYVKRFDQLPENEKKLSPEWVPEQLKPKLAPAKTTSDVEMTREARQKANQEVSAAIKGTDFDSKVRLTVTEVGHNPFNTPPRTPIGDRESIAPSTIGWTEDGSTIMSTTGTSHTKKSADAFESAKTFQPCKHTLSKDGRWVADELQSLSNHTEKRSHVLSPLTLPAKEPAASIFLTRNLPNFSALCRLPRIPPHSVRLLLPSNGLCAIKHIPISSVTPSATAIVPVSSSLVVLVSAQLPSAPSVQSFSLLAPLDAAGELCPQSVSSLESQP